MTGLKEGDKAPDFRGVIENGSEVSLANYSGKKLVLYFILRIIHQVALLKLVI